MGNALKDQGKDEKGLEALQQSASLAAEIMLKPTTTWAIILKVNAQLAEAKEALVWKNALELK